MIYNDLKGFIVEINLKVNGLKGTVIAGDDNGILVGTEDGEETVAVYIPAPSIENVVIRKKDNEGKYKWLGVGK